MYYIENIDKPNIIQKIVGYTKLEGNIIKIPIESLKNNEKKITKLVQKTNKIIQNAKSNKIILSKTVFENEIYKNQLYSYGYDIVDGKWLFEAIACDILDYIIEQKSLKKEEISISVLVNDLSEYSLENIKQLAKEYKMLSIVTNHIDKFKKIENLILEESGLMITVNNNNKKSLIKSNIILNIDFPNELINKYNIYEEAIIVSIHKKIKIRKKRFNGIIINDYEIEVDPQAITETIDKDKYYMKHLYEAEFYKTMPYLEMRKKVKQDKLKIFKKDFLF